MGGNGVASLNRLIVNAVTPGAYSGRGWTAAVKALETQLPPGGVIEYVAVRSVPLLALSIDTKGAKALKPPGPVTRMALLLLIIPAVLIAPPAPCESANVTVN